MKIVAEILAYAVFALAVGVLSVWPRYEIVEPEEAVISLAFSHAADRIGECRTLSQQELNELPPNMRRPSDCPRERHPIRVELRSGEDRLYAATLPPSGIWADGKANVYRRIVVPAGVHEIFVGMNDSGGTEEFDVDLRTRMTIESGRNVVIRFDGDTNRFSIR